MTETNTTNGEILSDALPREMARVRDEVMPAYIEIGPAGHIALVNMRHELNLATKALAEQDVVQMLRSLESLRGFHT